MESKSEKANGPMEGPINHQMVIEEYVAFCERFGYEPSLRAREDFAESVFRAIYDGPGLEIKRSETAMLLGDQVDAFISDCCTTGPDLRATCHELYMHFLCFGGSCSRLAFGRQMNARFLIGREDGARAYIGLCLGKGHQNS